MIEYEIRLKNRENVMIDLDKIKEIRETKSGKTEIIFNDKSVMLVPAIAKKLKRAIKKYKDVHYGRAIKLHSTCDGIGNYETVLMVTSITDISRRIKLNGKVFTLITTGYGNANYIPVYETKEEIIEKLKEAKEKLFNDLF